MSKPVVYIVDDDEDVLRSLRVVLSRTYTVHVSTNPPQAVEEIRAKKPEVVILDIKMPGHDGFWMFRQIRGFDTSVPIIFNSAYQDVVAPEDIQGAFAPFAYLTKTGNLAAFLEVLARAAAHGRSKKGAEIAG